jgi:hypothetical protein
LGDFVRIACSIHHKTFATDFMLSAAIGTAADARVDDVKDAVSASCSARRFDSRGPLKSGDSETHLIEAPVLTDCQDSLGRQDSHDSSGCEVNNPDREKADGQPSREFPAAKEQRAGKGEQRNGRGEYKQNQQEVEKGHGAS